jgi:hypothetical protein
VINFVTVGTQQFQVVCDVVSAITIFVMNLKNAQIFAVTATLATMISTLKDISTNSSGAVTTKQSVIFSFATSLVDTLFNQPAFKRSAIKLQVRSNLYATQTLIPQAQDIDLRHRLAAVEMKTLRRAKLAATFGFGRKCHSKGFTAKQTNTQNLMCYLFLLSHASSTTCTLSLVAALKFAFANLTIFCVKLIRVFSHRRLSYAV